MDLDSSAGPPIPYLGYSSTAFLTRIADQIISGAPFENRLRTVYRATLAESLCSAALAGMGLAWLPSAIASPYLASGELKEIAGPWRSQMTIWIFRAPGNHNPINDRIWNYLKTNKALES